MDAVELGRREAAELHAHAALGGADLWDPYAFVVTVAAALDYMVEPTAAGGANLAGGRAIIVPDDRLIVHEDVGSRFNQAFLVAHEIGHLVLGDAADAAVAEVDPSRTAEPSPIGMDRVEDYGRRQRREVQMDLFARELILPRPVAKKLLVNCGKSAMEIAQLLGAPFDVVAQQLMDALLLPVVPDAPAMERKGPELDCGQRAAASHRGHPYLLGAGPGTGKTQTLVARLEGLLADGVDPRRILVLTFSNKAAGEMSERIAHSRPAAAAAMWMGTFHAFGLDLIRIYHAELGLPGDPLLMDRVEAAELLEREFPRLSLVHYRNLVDPTQVIADMLSAISRAKDEVADPDRYAECAALMLARATQANDAAAVLAAERAAEVARVYEAYEELKSAARRVDFGDLVAMPVRLLENHPGIDKTVRDRYDHVLVDEYQDVNRASVRLIKALTNGGAELWAVGDAKQSIYRFRGASSFNTARFGVQDFATGVRGRLEYNYRSVAEVVEAFSAFAAEMLVSVGDAGLGSDRGPGGHPLELRTVATGGEQSAALADGIREMRAAGNAWRDQAVLCTGNERLSEIARDLERLGIPVLFLGSLFERPEVKDLASLASLLVEPRAMGLVRTACMAGFAMAMPDLSAALDHYRAFDRVADRQLGGSAIEGMSAEGRSSMAALAAALNGFDETARPWDVLATVLLDRTRIAAEIAGSADIVERSKGIAIWQFMNFVRVQPPGKGLPVRRLLDRIRRLVRLSEDRDLRQIPAAARGLDAVRLMTVHGAKGLEFPVVHLPGMSGDTMPRAAQTPSCSPPDGMIEGASGEGVALHKAGHAEEQECLFYVALSRARDRLLLYAATAKSNGHSRPLSRFLDRLGLNVARRAVVPSETLPSEIEALPIEVEGDGLRFAASQVSLYESCPRRFLYTHVLRVGGRRVTTAFMLMHEAVATMVGGIVAGAVTIDRTAIRALAATACIEAGLDEDGCFNEYVGLAAGLVEYFLSTRAGLAHEAPTALKLVVDGHEILFNPDDVVLDAAGIRHIRRIRTGHARSNDAKDVGASALMLAARAAFPGAIVEIVHLSDSTLTPLSSAKGDGGRAKLARVLASIASGAFPVKRSFRTCPGCPGFFICGPLPPSVLRKIF